MFSQNLRLPYMESPVGLSSGFFKPEYTQYNSQWDASVAAHGYENHPVYENESDSALSKIYTLGEDKPMLLSPLMPDQLTRPDMFTPEMKTESRLDDLELQVLSSAPSELSSWSESEEKPNLVKYDSESSLEHLHSIHFSPEQFSACGPRLNFNYANDSGFHHEQLQALGHGRTDPYQLGWRYLGHEIDNSNNMDLTEMVDGVFSGNPAPATAEPDEQKKTQFETDHSKDNTNMPVGLRNAMNSGHRTFIPALDARTGSKPLPKLLMNSKRKQAVKTETPPAENFMLSPWPVNDGAMKGLNDSKGHECNSSLRVPLPCLSATERWRKHTEKYTLDPKLCGDMVCTHCDQTFDDVERFITHLDEEKVVHDNFCPDTSCPFAALGFRYRWLLRRHICNHHLKDYNNKKLRKNPASPGAKNALTDNFLSHVYVCKKKNCSRAFYRLDSLLRHEKLIHSAGSKQKRKERLKLGKCDPKIFE